MKRKEDKFAWDLHWENKVYKLKRPIVKNNNNNQGVLKHFHKTTLWSEISVAVCKVKCGAEQTRMSSLNDQRSQFEVTRKQERLWNKEALTLLPNAETSKLTMNTVNAVVIDPFSIPMTTSPIRIQNTENNLPEYVTGALSP